MLNSVPGSPSYQPPDDVQGKVQRHPKSQGNAVAFVDVCRQVSDHDLLDDEKVGRAHAAAKHADDVGVVKTGHDLELVLWS